MSAGKCPGLYCGRMMVENVIGDCGACDRGWMRNSSDPNHLCFPCNKNLESKDFLFLSFNCIVPLLIHLFIIDFTAKTPKK